MDRGRASTPSLAESEMPKPCMAASTGTANKHPLQPSPGPRQQEQTAQAPAADCPRQPPSILTVGAYTRHSSPFSTRIPWGPAGKLFLMSQTSPVAAYSSELNRRICRPCEGVSSARAVQEQCKSSARAVQEHVSAAEPVSSNGEGSQAGLSQPAQPATASHSL